MTLNPTTPMRHLAEQGYTDRAIQRLLQRVASAVPTDTKYRRCWAWL